MTDFQRPGHQSAPVEAEIQSAGPEMLRDWGNSRTACDAKHIHPFPAFRKIALNPECIKME
jgi:hypothetical protein